MDWKIVALLGILGGLIPEVMRIIAALRNDQAPTLRHYLASSLTALLGLGVLLFENTNASALQIAIQGAAFPSLFSGLVAAAVPRDDSRGGGTITIIDYLAWRR